MSNNQDKTLNKSDMDKKQSTLPIMKRLLGYVLKNYKFSCIAVLACIIASALITLSATLFIQKLVDNLPGRIKFDFSKQAYFYF